MKLKFVIIIAFVFDALFGLAQVASLQPLEDTIHQVMNEWHKAAGRADAGAFFGAMAKDGIYLGTDASERWLRDDFERWAKPHFDKGKAWDFKAISRVVYFSPDARLCWFEETLDTWMGPCRGSGILQKDSISNRWLIHHYNLAMLIPNEKVDSVLKVLKEN